MHNELDLNACQIQIKFGLEIERKICKNRKESQKFIKFSLIYETYNIIVSLLDPGLCPSMLLSLAHEF